MVGSIFFFPRMFSSRQKANVNFSVTFILSSANTSNLDKSKFSDLQCTLSNHEVFILKCNFETVIFEFLLSK